MTFSNWEKGLKFTTCSTDGSIAIITRTSFRIILAENFSTNPLVIKIAKESLNSIGIFEEGATEIYVTGSNSGELLQIDLDLQTSFNLDRNPHKKAIRDIKVKTSKLGYGTLLAALSEDGLISLWKYKEHTVELSSTAQGPANAWRLAWSATGSHISVFSKDSSQVYALDWQNKAFY